jgi:protein TonB
MLEDPVVDEGVLTEMDTSLVYRKSGLGAAQLAHGRELSPRERHVLILLDGRRTIAELSDLFGAETIQRVVPELEEKGFAKRVDPAPADEWANAITLLYVPPAEPRKPAPVRHPDIDSLVWIALLIVFTIAGSYLAADRYRSHADAAWRLDQARTLAQAPPIDAQSLPTSTDAIYAYGPERVAPGVITPITRLPRVTASNTAAAISPAGAAAKAVAREHPAVVRTGSRSASPVTAKASTAAASAPPSAPMEDVAPAPAAQLDATVAAALAPMPVTIAAEAPAAPMILLATAPIAPPGPIAAANLAASAPRTEVVIQAPAPPPASDPVGLRPLLRDPPRFPERALRDGIVESQVRARLWVTPEGKVDQVDIVQATPPGLFDDEVRRALSLWTYEPPGRPVEQVVDLTLKP